LNKVSIIIIIINPTSCGPPRILISRVQLHSTDLHHGLKTVGSLFKNAFLTRVRYFWLVFIRVRHFLLVFTRVRQFLTRVHSCSSVFDSCSLVFTNFWLVFTRVVSCSLVFTRVHSCSDSCGVLEQILVSLVLSFSPYIAFRARIRLFRLARGQP
jgi:hypothetical protein